MRNFFTLFRIVRRPYHAFDGILEDEVGQLVAGEEGADKCSAVCREDQDLFYGGQQVLVDGSGHLGSHCFLTADVGLE